jgi:hypothetical protein
MAWQISAASSGFIFGENWDHLHCERFTRKRYGKTGTWQTTWETTPDMGYWNYLVHIMMIWDGENMHQTGISSTGNISEDG